MNILESQQRFKHLGLPDTAPAAHQEPLQKCTWSVLLKRAAEFKGKGKEQGGKVASPRDQGQCGNAGAHPKGTWLDKQVTDPWEMQAKACQAL